jgi:hypothetical protein
MTEDEKVIMCGGEIFDYLHCPGFLVNSRRKKQWVSLDWLKQQIEGKLRMHDGCTVADCEGKFILTWFLSLLEEKPFDFKLGEKNELSKD